LWDDSWWDETLMMIRPCRQPLKEENNKLLGGWGW
jgi:hypothetical protein